MAANVHLQTSMGPIVLELYTEHAPKTCQNFRTLASRGYYDTILIHRIIPNFMIQTGDPTGTGRGGTSIYGASFDDEIHPSLKHTGAGILSMANSGPNTNGSQFFITLAPTPWLDGKHTIFGRVKEGLGVLRNMGNVRYVVSCSEKDGRYNQAGCDAPRCLGGEECTGRNIFNEKRRGRNIEPQGNRVLIRWIGQGRRIGR
ncbi:cyclophilin-like domain-containing protein [Amylocarpus encephaloides]|uniref:Peptidyl-prolyl cis-trans isomerase n=1 Tax=Amylocarpus encephaloides TaxID=45428 RepID=A0A9P7Y8M4_9HELO|nr:cyclophilin-like domain-containing protein [Amylocarpus encephaloides]